MAAQPRMTENHAASLQCVKLAMPVIILMHEISWQIESPRTVLHHSFDYVLKRLHLFHGCMTASHSEPKKKHAETNCPDCFCSNREKDAGFVSITYTMSIRLRCNRLINRYLNEKDLWNMWVLAWNAKANEWLMVKVANMIMKMCT